MAETKIDKSQLGNAYCTATRNGTYTVVATNTLEFIAMNGGDFSGMDITTNAGHITVAKAGVYKINYKVYCSTPGYLVLSFGLYKNATTGLNGSQSGIQGLNQASQGWTTVGSSFIVSLAAGDYIGLYIYMNSTGAAVTNIYGYSESACITIERIA